MSGVFLTEEMRAGVAYYGVWVGAGGDPHSGRFDVDNKLLCLCPHNHVEALETATAVAVRRSLQMEDLTK